MSYYKISKQDFLNFINEFQEPSPFTPTIVVGVKYFPIINKYLRNVKNNTLTTHSIKEQLEQNSNLQTAVERKMMIKLISEIYLNPNMSRENPNFLHNLFSKYQVEKANNSFQIQNESSKLLHMSFEEKIETLYFISEQTDNRFLNNSDVQNYANLIIYKLLNQELRQQHYPQIESMVLLGKQQHIIDVNFGNATNVSTQPIQNSDGLLQAYALNYINQDEIIIHSPSDINIIQQSLNNYSPLIELEQYEYQHLLDSNEFFLSFEDVLKINEFVEQNKSQNQTEKTHVDFIEEQMNIFNHENTTETEKLHIFVKAFNDFMQNDKHKYFTNIKLMGEHVALECSTNITDEYLKIIRKTFDEIYEIEKSIKDMSINFGQEFSQFTIKQRNILSILSPSSIFFSNKKISTQLKDELINLLSPTELTHLILYAYNIENKKYVIQTQTNYSTSFTKGATYTNNYFSLSSFSPFFDTLKNYILNFNDNNNEVVQDLNKSQLFKTLHQDLFPTLNLKNKLLKENYSAILEETYRLNLSHHFLALSLPGSLLLDDSIYKNILNKATNISLRSLDNIHYITEALTNRFYHFFENFDKNPQIIPDDCLLYINNGAGEKGTVHKDYFFKNIYSIENKDSTIDIIVKYIKFLENNDINPTSDNSLDTLISKFPATNMNITNSDAINLYQILKKTNSLNQNHAFSFVDNIVSNTEFSITDQDFVLDIYKDNNTCFSSESKTITINFFRKKFKNIFQYHEDNNTYSNNEWLNKNTFDNNTRNETFYTKPLLQEIEKMGSKYLTVFPNLITKVSEDIQNDPVFINDFLVSHIEKSLKLKNNNNTMFFIQLSRSFGQIKNQHYDNYKIFSNILNNYLLIIPKENDFAYNNNTLPKIQFPLLMNRFNPVFFNREEVIINILEFFQKHNKINGTTDFLKIMESINRPTSSFLKTIVREQNSNFDAIIDNIKNIQLTRNIFIHDKDITKTTSVKKFKF